jgi:uncharacterized protein YjdB
LSTVTVHIFNFDFSQNPKGQPIVDPTISVGDTIHWVWDEGFHSTTSVAGIAETWNSGTHSSPATFDHTFTHVGTFAYYCTIHGTDNGDGTASNMSGTITVGAPTLTSITVNPPGPSVAKGDSEQFTATGNYSNNSTQDLTTQVTWTSADMSVATVNAAGLASTTATGSSKISATLGSITGSSVLTVNPAVVRSIAVMPGSASVAKGDAQQFTATGTYSDSSQQDLTSQVTWASGDTSVAAINASGLASTLKVGTTSISATLGTLSKSAVLTVTPAVVRTITVAPDHQSIPKGLTQQFTASGTFSDGSSQDLSSQVVWGSDTPAVATITSAGLAHGLGTGMATISAKLGAVMGSTVLTISPAVLQSLKVAPLSPNVAKGLTRQFTATGTYSDGSTQDLTSQVTWVSADTSVAIVDVNGLARALATGSSSISATLGALVDSSVLTVTPPVLSSIVLSPSGPSINPYTTVKFRPTGILSDNTGVDLTGQVTWASDTPGVATIDSTGLASAVAHGSSTITATDGSVQGSTTLTVKNVALVSIGVTPDQPSVAKGDKQAFHAIATFSDDSTDDLTGAVAWTSDTQSVATITSGGASAGLASTVGEGSATISAALAGVNGTAMLTVGPAVVRSLTVGPVGPLVPKGETQQFTATGTFSDGSQADVTNMVTWDSGTTAVATIDAGGLASAVTTGTSSISATLGTIVDSTTMTVTPGALVSIAVAPHDPDVAKGDAEQFTATGTFSDRSTADLTADVVWVSDTPGVATISAGGLASTLATGMATISATSGSVSGSSVLNVTAAVLRSLAVAPVAPNVAKGDTVQFSAMGTFSDSSTQDLTSQVTWDSDTPGVATITSAGLASTLATGQATISATQNGKSAESILMVGPAVLRTIAVSPLGPSVALGDSQQFAATGTLSDGTMQDLTGQVIWFSATATVATINSAGLASTFATGSSQISATQGALSGSSTLTVTPAVVRSIKVMPVGASVAKGDGEQFTAIGTLSDGTSQDLTNQVTWMSDTPAVATINTTGLASTLSAGTSSITASLGAFSDSTTLTVGPAVLRSITVAPSGISIFKGDTMQFTATGTYSDGASLPLTGQVMWTTDTPAVATISAGGLASGLNAGSSTISAILGGVFGSTTLTVNPAALRSIHVTAARAGVPAGSSDQFTATGTFSDGTTADLTAQVTWSSGSTAVATISSAGLAHTLSAGTSSIGATLGAISDSAVLTVTPAALASINVTPADSSIAKGDTQQFHATAVFTDGSTQDMTGQVMWSLDTPAVAAISTSGLASAVSPGMAMVMAMMGDVMGMTSLTVTPAALRSIAITPTSPSLSKGQSRQLAATGTYSDGSTQDLTGQVSWMTSAAAVASVSASGLVHSSTVGTTTVTATLGILSGSTTLTVNAATLVSIAVAPATASLMAGSTAQFTALGTFSDGSMRDLTHDVAWASSAGTVATISSTGLAHAVSGGPASITATLGDVRGTAAVTVTPVPTVPPNPLFVATGTSLHGRVNKNQRGTVATFKDPHTKAGDFRATIYWGDADFARTSSPGTIRSRGKSRFAVIGSHVYHQAGTFQVTVTIEDAQGRIESVTSQVRVPR